MIRHTINSPSRPATPRRPPAPHVKYPRDEEVDPYFELGFDDGGQVAVGKQLHGE